MPASPSFATLFLKAADLWASARAQSDTLRAHSIAVSTQQYTTYQLSQSRLFLEREDPDPETDAHAHTPSLVPKSSPVGSYTLLQRGGALRPPPRTTADLSRPHLTLSHTTFRGPHPTESPRGRTGSPQTHSRTLADRIYTVTLDTTFTVTHNLSR